MIKGTGARGLGRAAARRCKTDRERETKLEPSYKADVRQHGQIAWEDYAHGWWSEVIELEYGDAGVQAMERLDAMRVRRNPSYGYVHFSSRPELPEVPPRAVNRFAGGSGPLGVYCYQTDVRQMTFAADRTYAFLLTPTVPVTYTNKYTEADLKRDLAKLEYLDDIARPLHLYERWLEEARPGPPFHKLWYVISRIPNPLSKHLPGYSGEGFANPARGRDLFVELGHRVIDDRYGIMYASEPEQAVFLTNDSFTAVAVSAEDARDRRVKVNPASKKKGDEDDVFARYRREHEATLAQVRDAFQQSPAIRGGGKYPQMVILSGELSDRKYGDHRVTFIGPDGPHGHQTKRTLEQCYEEVARSLSGPFEPMTDDDVIAWTSTPEYQKGSRVIAFVQAENTLRWFAQKAGRSDWAREVIESANEVGTRDGAVNVRGKPDDLDALEEATQVLVEAIGELPVPNPRVTPLVRNPAWVTGALADHYELLDDKVPSRWLPQLAGVRHERANMIAKLVEYGCGAYGCVLATNDPGTVLKVTTDDTEAEFASELAESLVAPICVDYRLVVRLGTTHKRRPIHLLWRESAEKVGGLKDVSVDAVRLLAAQHAAAQDTYAALVHGEPQREIRARLSKWVQRVDDMARAPELRALSEGLLRVWEDQRIFFGDIHDGNLGLVTRDDVERWVITDPGHVAVISDPDLWG